MNFLRRFYLDREIKRLEGELESLSEPNTVVKLIPLYVEIGESGKANALRKKGKELFPGIDFAAIVMDKPEETPFFNLAKEVEAVKLQIAESTNPWLYSRLAHLYVNSGDMTKGEEAAREANKYYPSHPVSYVILAEIEVLRNNKEKALVFFNRAIQVDSQSAISIVHLAEYYQEIKEFDKTRKLLEQLLMPSQISEAVPLPIPAKTTATEVVEKESHAPVKDEGFPIKESALEEAMKGVGHLEEVKDYINGLRALDFLQGVIVFNKDGKVLGSDLPYRLNEEDVHNSMNNLWRTAMAQSKQMSLGEYNYSAFEGETGSCLIIEISKYVFGLLFDKRRRLDQDQHKIFEFCKQIIK